MREIPLTQSKVALVDDEDYERVAQHRWAADKAKSTWYASARINGRRIRLHRFIVDAKPGQLVDHEDRNGLNCTRGNLRPCTHGQNCQNSVPRKNNKCGLKGVSFHYGKWMARISIGPQSSRKQIRLGRFDTPEEAAIIYDRAAIMHFGRFAYLNFPDKFTTWYEAGNEATI